MLRIAIEGCCHGELDSIYSSIAAVESSTNTKIDLLMICGDFEAIRNTADMSCMAVPAKHRRLGSFYKYYSGQVVAPVLTIFVSGNHEASNFLQELPYGGWVAPNIYYIGYAGVINFGGLRIAGLSGIYKAYNFNKGHFERYPYNDNDLRSVYHTREIEIFKLLQLRHSSTSPSSCSSSCSVVDIFLSHDWPRGIHKFGNEQQLLRKKMHFKADIDNNDLGSPATETILQQLQPTFWFAAHLHVKFAALVRHNNTSGSRTTRFLSLDKCLPARDFLQVIEVPAVPGFDKKLVYDREWLAILRATHQFDSTLHYAILPPLNNDGRYDFQLKNELEEVDEIFKESGFTIPLNFIITAPSHPCGFLRGYQNPQSEEFCHKLFGPNSSRGYLLNFEDNHGEVSPSRDVNASSISTTTPKQGGGGTSKPQPSPFSPSDSNTSFEEAFPTNPDEISI